MIGVMLYIDWRFALVALSVAPILFLVVYVYTRRIKKASREVRKQESELLSGLAEVLGSIHVVQAFAREDYQQRRFDSESRHSMQAGLQARSMKARLRRWWTSSSQSAPVWCLATAHGWRMAGEISAGVLIVFLLYLGKTYKPMRDLSKMTNAFSKAAVAYERIQEVLEIDSRIRDLPDARQAPPFKGEIEFDHVSFSYTSDAPVLKDVSFRIAPGQVAAIVGPSGTGKSTIVSLISRFFDPQHRAHQD